MKRILTIVLLAVLLPGMLLATGASLPSYYGQSYYAQLPAMVENLESTESPKVVVVGGSNVAFGLDTAQMEALLAQQGLDYRVCSFGLYAAVGTAAMLQLSQNAIQPGDIVILAIEPTSETFSTYFGSTALWKCAEDAPWLLGRLNKTQRAAMVGNYLGYLQERLAIRRSGLLPQPEGAYAKASFNDRCDMIYDRAGNAMALGYDTATPIDLSQVTLEPDFVEEVAAYCHRLQAKGATVYFSFSPMNRGAMVSEAEDVVYDFFLRCQDAFPCPVISNPHDYIWDSGWFYDSNFHLNSPGAQLRTAQLTQDLLNYLGCNEKLDFTPPQMPASIYTPEETPGDSQDLILEALAGGGWLVTGLTETGRNKSSLVIPASVAGSPVVALDSQALAGAGALESLTLPGSLTHIPDGVFRDCPRLKTLTLLHTTTTPTVGSGLLEGADALTILVPAASHHLYRDGAGCAANPWEDYLSHIQTY